MPGVLVDQQRIGRCLGQLSACSRPNFRPLFVRSRPPRGRSLARLHAGYSFASSMRAFSPQFKIRARAGFMDLQEPPRTLLNGDAAIQHLEIAIPKPGVRGSSPLRDANEVKDSGGITRLSPLYLCPPLGPLQSAPRASGVSPHPVTRVRQWRQSWKSRSRPQRLARAKRGGSQQGRIRDKGCGRGSRLDREPSGTVGPV
jgi:hypothetical protein